MTIQFNWPPEVVSRLSEEARSRGLTLEEYLLKVVLQGREPASDNDERRRGREQAAADIEALRKGNILGPDLTVRDLIEEGRRF